MVSGMESKGMLTDFHPSIGGAFVTEVYTLPTRIGRHEIELSYGILPEEVFGGNLNIVGTEVLKHFPVTLRFSHREFVVG